MKPPPSPVSSARVPAVGRVSANRDGLHHGVASEVPELPAPDPRKDAGRPCLSPWRFPTLDHNCYWLVTCARLFLALGPLQVGNLNEAMRVLQLKLPLFAKYWFVYQKVQSSTGSMLMLL